jgi:hypothetical protein
VASVDSCLRLFSSRSSHGHLVGETDRRSTTGADIPDDWRGSGKADYSQLGIELVAVSDDAPSSLWPRTIGDASSDTHPGHARTFARLNAAGRDAVRCALKAVAGTRPQAARPRDDAHADRRIRTRQRLSEAGSSPDADRAIWASSVSLVVYRHQRHHSNQRVGNGVQNCRSEAPEPDPPSSRPRRWRVDAGCGRIVAAPRWTVVTACRERAVEVHGVEYPGSSLGVNTGVQPLLTTTASQTNHTTTGTHSVTCDSRNRK